MYFVQITPYKKFDKVWDAPKLINLDHVVLIEKDKAFRDLYSLIDDCGKCYSISAADAQRIFTIVGDSL